MMFDPAPAEDPEESFFAATLPAVRCTTCGRLIARRKHRVQIRASWRGCTDTLCPGCWRIVCQWATRFALQQLELPLGG